MRIKSLNNEKKSKEEKDTFTKNFCWFVLSIIIFTILIILQIIRWQVFEHEKFQTLATQQHTNKQRSSSGRGIIYASNGTILAIDEPSWGVYATLSSDKKERELFFQHKEKFTKEISKTLEIDEKEILEKITKDFVYFPIMNSVPNDKKKALEELKIFGPHREGFGLHFEKEEKRIYPNNRLASHVLGFIGKNEKGEDIGNYGIEGYYWGDITGHKTHSYEERDAQGNIILTVRYEPLISREGKDIVLTIEPAIQSKVEKVLKEGVHHHRAKSGTAIIMDPKTGAIIAMATYPDFNPNEYWKTTDSGLFRNKAISDVYEYGSTHKPISIAIALEKKKIDEDYLCEDHLGYIEIDKETIRTWDRKPSGTIGLSEILEKSNNPCVAKIAIEIGVKDYYSSIEKFGIGQFIGIGLEDESNSYLKPPNQWSELDLAVSSFGQSISATPLQIISALSVFANDGKRMKPYIVSEIIEDTEIIKHTPTKINQTISKETANTVAKYMENVVTQGESQYIFNLKTEGYSIAGKTGTAQIPKRHSQGYYENKTNTTFVGFSPTEDAKMIMFVKLEEPQTDIYSASTVVPVWIDIFNAVKDDLQIQKK